MENKKVTSLEVAKLAGVSQSAVSRVFTPGASSSKKTNELVRKAAAKLGYRPNVLARSLITGKSRIIGLVVAYLDNYFYPEALELLSSALQKKGYHVLIFMAGNTEDDIGRRPAVVSSCSGLGRGANQGAFIPLGQGNKSTPWANLRFCGGLSICLRVTVATRATT